MKTAIITEKLGTYETQGSTKIANEALTRGYQVYEVLPAEISHSAGKLTAKARNFTGVNQPQNDEYIILEEMNVIHFRPNPPVDMAYLSTLYLLDSIKHKTLIANNPESIIKFPEKIFPLQFPDFTPTTLITKDIEELRKFLEKHKEIVLKPLYEYGGKGIRKVKLEEFAAEESSINLWLNESKLPIIAQQFLPKVVHGEKRILFLGGEVFGAYLRIPANGGYLSNIAQGGSSAKTQLTNREVEFAQVLGPHLKKNGIYICGIDVIENLVIEINITSVGFSQIEMLYNIKPEVKLWDLIEKDLK